MNRSSSFAIKFARRPFTRRYGLCPWGRSPRTRTPRPVQPQFLFLAQGIFNLPGLLPFPCDKRSAEHGARCTLRSTCVILQRRTPIAGLDFLAAPASRFNARVRDEMNGRGCVRKNILGNEKAEFAAHETARSASQKKALGTLEMGAELLKGKLLGRKI